MNVQGLVNCCMDSAANYRASWNARPAALFPPVDGVGAAVLWEYEQCC